MKTMGFGRENGQMSVARLSPPVPLRVSTMHFESIIGINGSKDAFAERQSCNIAPTQTTLTRDLPFGASLCCGVTFTYIEVKR
ncbi:hypothetical protein MFFC18_00060 [Mariniblastus fucicola]|uniref:Uncharacterized protein n=1 Tax=Mariniblastus fucicola TaxID=980251 RepID=A0A5B9P3V7_9BACT|nr:hypothetical protein MFFC18_00060 [Mariniblastus fucicola]